jgi:hypothetical protein
MEAVVWHGVGDISLDEVPDPTIQQPTEARSRSTRQSAEQREAGVPP